MVGMRYAIEAETQIKYLEERLAEAKVLLHESVDRYPVEEKQELWTSRVRAWLRKYDG